MSAEIIQPVSHAGTRLVDGLDPVGLVLFLICVWQIWTNREQKKESKEELKAMTDRFIELAEKTNITQEKLCNLIQGMAGGRNVGI